jgi:nucleotide-binding universal stress UspA family protein
MNIPKFTVRQALTAMDLSDSDNSILEYIDFLNREIRFDSIFFLHVIRKPSFFSNLFSKNSSALQSQFILNEDILKHFISDVEGKLSNLENINVEYEVCEGEPLQEIIEKINEHHVDLVIIGKKSASETSGLLVKSLARRSPCSVLFVPTVAEKKLKTILVPVDFSENSGRALQKALEINHSLDKPAKIISLHVFDMPDLSYYKINKTYEQLKEIIEADMNEAFDNFLEKYVPNLKDIVEKKVHERTQLSTAGHLNSLASDYEADLIVMGAKGHSTIEIILLGSVTEKFIYSNDLIPTLIVR